MRVHIILLLVVAWLATSQAGPQRNRQDNPLSMGMKFLGNLRNTMSSAVSGLFRPRSRPSKARPQRPPPPQHQQQHQQPPNLPPHQLAGHQVPDHVTHSPQNSFFTVVHEESEIVTRAPAPAPAPAPALHSRPHVDDDDSFQPSTFFSNNRPTQGSFEQENFSAPKRPNDFGFGKPKDESKIRSTFSQEVNTRPSFQNFQSSGEANTRPSHHNFQSSSFQQGSGQQSGSASIFPSSNVPIGFSQFSREEPIGFKQSSSSPSSSASSFSSSSSSPSPSSSSSSFSSSSSSAGSSSSFKHSSSSVTKKPQNQLPIQENHIPDIFTVPDPQRREPITTKDKFASSITPIKPSFTHRLTQTRPSTTTHHITPTSPSTQTFSSPARPSQDSRLPSAAIPSGPKKPLFPPKPVTGDRHINNGLKLQVAPKTGTKIFTNFQEFDWSQKTTK